MSNNVLRYNYACLMFYMREKLWKHGEGICSDVVKSYDNWIFRVWRAFCYDQQGMTNEALREYRSAEQHRDTVLPALVGISIIYRRNGDKEGLTMTERALEEPRHADNVDGWLHAATLAWAAGDLSRSRDMLSRIQLDESEVGHRNEYTNLDTFRGWLDLQVGRGATLEKCGSLFEKVMQSESVDEMDIEATMGRISYLERKFQFFPAQELLNKLIVVYPHFLPALVVKARQLLKAEDWEQAMETTQRVLAKDHRNLDAIGLSALNYLVKDVKYAAAASQLNTLLEAVQHTEPRNAPLLLSYATCFSRLSGGNLQLLAASMKFAEAALQMQPNNAACQAAVGNIHLLRGDFQTALTTLQPAAAASDDLGPTLGVIKCLILTGKLQEAAQQIEFPNELHSGEQGNAELSLLNAMLLWRRSRDEMLALMHLDQAAEALRRAAGAQPVGLDLYIHLNPPLMIEVAKEYMQFCRNEPPSGTFEQADPIAEKCRRHLSLLIRYVPGSTEAQLLISKVYFVSGELGKAQTTIAATLRHEQTIPEAYLLSAQVCHYVGNLQLANMALEQALTLDFEVKDQPTYNLLHGTILAAMERHEKALEALKLALQLVKDPAPTTATGRPVEALSVNDHVSLYLQLAHAHLKLHDVEAARAVVAEAANTFKNSPQAGRVTIANAMLLARNDVGAAIEVLQQVSTRSDYYVAARTRLANLYLAQRNDRAKYLECFDKMVKECPGTQSYLAQGEAYAAMQEPDKAIQAFEKARESDPENSELATRIGRALVSTHDYQRAVTYYTDAIAASRNTFVIRADLATLHWRLDNVDDAMEVLAAAPAYKSAPDTAEDITVSIERVNCALLMYKFLKGSGNDERIGEVLQQAKRFQDHVLEPKMRMENRDTVFQQRSVAATIAVAMGKHYLHLRDANNAKECFTMALKHEETNEHAILCLARFHLRRGKLDLCAQQCNTLLRINPDCQDAVLLLADVTMRQGRFEDAASHFAQLLERKPDNYDALVQYVEILCRSGRPADADAMIAKAEALLGREQSYPPELHYARGRFLRATYRTVDALAAFNRARVPAGTRWGKLAIINMVELYLVPGTEDLWVDRTSAETRSSNVRNAEKLLLQLPKGEDRDTCHAMCKLATKIESEIYEAYGLFTDINKRRAGKKTKEATMSQGGSGAKAGGGDGADEDEEDEDKKLLEGLPDADEDEEEDEEEAAVVEAHSSGAAVCGMAIAHYLVDEEEFCRGVIEQLSGLPQTTANADAVQRAHMLLAFMDFKAGEYDAAATTLLKVIEENKGAAQAWDLLGMVYERQQKHAEAADSYTRAWELVGEREPSVGYKLAFNLMKALKPVAAIDVCRKVLNDHPAYPKIREEVLDPCYGMLRQ